MNKWTIENEYHRRMDLWRSVIESGGPRDVSPTLLHGLRIYKGQQGIYRDVKTAGCLGNLKCKIVLTQPLVPAT